MRVIEFLDSLRWIDGTPLRDHMEPYRRRIFTDTLDSFEEDGRPRYNMVLTGRAKKNWKSADLVTSCLYCLLADSPGGNQCYLLANDEGQANDNLGLAKKLITANPALKKGLAVRQKSIVRRDGQGFLEILPARDVAGTHGKTYRLAAFDEIHEYRDWDLLEAMQLDPTRLDAQIFITSYASIFHKPNVPLFDLCASGWAGNDPRFYFSWYGGDRTTDPDFADADPETRANPSRGSWVDTQYLAQQQRRLPAHKYRRLHLNLPGLPEGSAFQPEPVMQAVARGVSVRVREPDVAYKAFVDMSGGSNDDAVLAIGYRDPDGRAVLARIVNQGSAPPFDPIKAVKRFVDVLKDYGVATITGDRYAGETFRAAFEDQGIAYRVSDKTKSQLYETVEPALNSRQMILLDVPAVEQQLLGLVWRGGKIDHLSGEHDDWANAVAGVVMQLTGDRPRKCCWCGGDCVLFCERTLSREASDEAAETAKAASTNMIEAAIRGQGVWWPGEGASSRGDTFEAAQDFWARFGGD